jgi:Clp amino terminal domain, pathogenicity island component
MDGRTGPIFADTRSGLRSLRRTEEPGHYDRGMFCEMPRTIEPRAWELARETGYPVVAAELFLVAIAELPEGTPARDVLVSLGLDAERLMRETEAHWRAGPDPGPDSSRRLGYSPQMSGIMGMATGLAVSLGDGDVTPEHLLIALVWDAHSGANWVLRRAGVSREDIIEGLRSRGVTMPPAPLPPFPRDLEVTWGETVELDKDDFGRVFHELERRLLPDKLFCFGGEGGRVHVNAEEGVDLRALIDEILGS